MSAMMVCRDRLLLVLPPPAPRGSLHVTARTIGAKRTYVLRSLAPRQKALRIVLHQKHATTTTAQTTALQNGSLSHCASTTTEHIVR